MICGGNDPRSAMNLGHKMAASTRRTVVGRGGRDGTASHPATPGNTASGRTSGPSTAGAPGHGSGARHRQRLSLV
jgi:hypothetical protein